MAQWLKQSTIVTIQLGPFLDEDDGKTAEAGLAIAQADVQLSKNGAAFAQKNDVNAAAHDAGGWYRCQINATDTNTLGRLIVAVHESGALPVWREFMVVPANEYDSLIAGSDVLEVDTTLIEGGDATDAINAAVDVALDTAIPGAPTADSINQRVVAIDDLTQAAGGGDLAAILADTNELQADNVPGLIAALNDPTAVAIRTEIDTNSTQLALIVADTNELQTDDVPGLIAALNDPTAVAIRTEIDTNSTQLALIVADTNELQTDDVPGLIAALNDPTAIAIADAVLSRGVANVEDAADTTSLAALVLAAFESAVVGVVWTIRKTGGAAFAVKAVTLDPAADPIIGVT